jgi:hypothetical protein
MNTLTSKLSDSEIEEAFKKIGCDIDVGGEYGEPERFAITNDTLQGFIDESFKWLKCGSRKYAPGTDKKAAIFKDVSTKAGERRFDLYVVDFGDIRIACKF